MREEGKVMTKGCTCSVYQGVQGNYKRNVRCSLLKIKRKIRDESKTEKERKITNEGKMVVRDLSK